MKCLSRTSALLASGQSKSPRALLFPITSFTPQQSRNASLLRRPLRPYMFTQLVTLSDGSAYLQRSTSPISVIQSQKDSRSSAMWNPSNRKLAYLEDDDAGRLKQFRSRFGRAWDSDSGEEGSPGENIADLMNTYNEEEAAAAAAAKKSKK